MRAVYIHLGMISSRKNSTLWLTDFYGISFYSTFQSYASFSFAFLFFLLLLHLTEMRGALSIYNFLENQ